MKNTVITIVGPTAVGKTSLSIEMAKRFDGEVISGDSMQVYREMDIGTAKITENEMHGIPHYMLNIKDPDEPFSVAEFQSYVQGYIKEISNKQKLPIIVGGSGLYIQSILYDYQFSKEEKDPNITEKLEQEIKIKGGKHLHEKLKQIDHEQAKGIHPNNHRRLVRALEIYLKTGKTPRQHALEQKKHSPYDNLIIGLEMEREILYERINRRVDFMMEKGLLQEVKDLYEKGLRDCQSMQAIGYKEFIPYFQGEQTLERSIELLKRNSRRFAKRQYTWFKNKMDVKWYDVTQDNDIFPKIFNDLAGIIKNK